MNVLERGSSGLLVLGGALMTIVLLVMTVAPTTPLIGGFILIAPAIGLGILGLQWAVGRQAGRLAGLAAWCAVLGGIAVVIVGGYALATDQFPSGAGGDDPLAIPFAATSMVWMLGSLGFAAVLTARRLISSLGGWLVLAGTISAIVLGTVLGALAPQVSPLSALPFGLGWLVIGRDGRSARV